MTDAELQIFLFLGELMLGTVAGAAAVYFVWWMIRRLVG